MGPLERAASWRAGWSSASDKTVMCFVLCGKIKFQRLYVRFVCSKFHRFHCIYIVKIFIRSNLIERGNDYIIRDMTRLYL